jgi:hypothetical protein
MGFLSRREVARVRGVTDVGRPIEISLREPWPRKEPNLNRSTRRIATAMLAMTATSLVAASNVDARDPQVAPTTTVPIPTTLEALPTTVLADDALPVFATCEEAINSPSNTEPCDADELEAFARWGGKIAQLYADDLPVDLGVWDPIGDDDWEFNESVLYACIGVMNGQDEYVWLDEQLLSWTDYSASANEKLFDAAMQYVCSDLNYQRNNEWDFHVPASFSAAPTTTVAAPTTTVAAPTTTVPTPTTAPAPPTAVAGTTTDGETTTLINTSDGMQPYTCGMLLPFGEEQESCAEGFQILFNDIVVHDPTAFDTYVYDQDLGFFSTQEVNVAQTAFVGLWACLTMATQDPYTGYDAEIRGFFPTATSADTQLAWDAAALVLCPFLAQ